MKINPSKSKAGCFTRARVKGPLKYSLLGTLVPEASSCKYLGITVRSDLSWADHLHGEKGVESFSLYNANTQKREIATPKDLHTRHWFDRFWNTGPRAGILTGMAR